MYKTLVILAVWNNMVYNEDNKSLVPLKWQVASLQELNYKIII
ncbi:hypothetical protein [Clostridium sp. CF012]|nr:hypothetical protein [Clostridium sp. CF012]